MDDKFKMDTWRPGTKPNIILYYYAYRQENKYINNGTGPYIWSISIAFQNVNVL